MKNFEEQKLDELFRSGLIAADVDEVDQDWALMKARLQSEQRRSTIARYTLYVTSLAALFLLAFAVNYYTGQSAVESDTALALAPAPLKIQDAEVSGRPELQVQDHAEQGTRLTQISIQPVYEVLQKETSYEAAQEVHLTKQDDIPPVVDGALVASTADPVSGTVSISQAEPTAETTSLAQSSPEQVESPFKQEEEPSLSKSPAKSRFSLAVNFAPDINGVEHFQANKVSYSIGAGLIYTINKRLALEAGAAYGKKSYQTGFSSFRPVGDNFFQVRPNAVSSGFDVMDIQLNMSYTLMHAGKNSLGIGAGISSYLMLDEQYSFSYQNMKAHGITGFSTGYQNNHFLGIANLNLSYKRSLTDKFKLSLNPYLKLPLTDLGYGNIRLRSAGVSVGVITNLNKSKK